MKKIKLKKAAYSDRISTEIIKASSDILIEGFIKVFNMVLKSGNFPTDHILTLKTLHDKYVNRHKNGKIYPCFVDFRKALDSVWLEGLLLKLLQNKIGGKFYDLIKNLYSNTQCAIKYSNQGQLFSHTRKESVKDVFSALCHSISI